jgi:RNA polymerase sigma factor (sigma-70 family)
MMISPSTGAPSVSIFADTLRAGGLRSRPGRDSAASGESEPARDEAMVSGAEASTRFREVVLPHLPDALALARWLTGNGHDAEDVVQDACIKALAGIGTYAGGSARAWLLTIVRNAAFTWLARNRPRDLVLVADPAEVVPAASEPQAESPEASLIAKADEVAVEAAIAALPHPFREVLVLRDINGLNYREIAAMLGVPLGTVMSRLSRARDSLALALGGRR